MSLYQQIPEFSMLDTPRLRLRRFRASDVDEFVAYRNIPEVAQYQSWDGYTHELAREFIESQQTIHPGMPDEWFQFAIERKDSGELIGDCALYTNTSDHPQGEIGFTLSPQFQGKGYATEAVSAVFDYAFGVLNLNRIIGIADCLNDGSIALMERIGMRREAHFIQHIWFKGRWSDEFWYAMLRSEWLEQHSQIAPKSFS